MLTGVIRDHNGWRIFTEKGWRKVSHASYISPSLNGVGLTGVISLEGSRRHIRWTPLGNTVAVGQENMGKMFLNCFGCSAQSCSGCDRNPEPATENPMVTNPNCVGCESAHTCNTCNGEF